LLFQVASYPESKHDVEQKSTVRETQAQERHLHFLLMAKTISAAPLFARLKSRGAKAAFAKQLLISEQVLANWKKRGIPASRIPAVSAALQMTMEEYYRLSGNDSDQKIKKQFMPGSDSEKLFVLLRTLLDTDAETREEIFAAVNALTGDDHGTSARRSKPKRG
jgi:hypothetical protein